MTNFHQDYMNEPPGYDAAKQAAGYVVVTLALLIGTLITMTLILASGAAS